MSDSERSDSRPRRRRRWKSADEAFEAGKVVGFTTAIELVRLLNDPRTFIERVEAVEREFGNNIRAIMGAGDVE